MSANRCLCILVIYLAHVAPAWGGHTLTPAEQTTLKSWLGLHPAFRLATDDDCDCWSDIKQMSAGGEGVWKPVPDYHPYTVTGDFNGDGAEDFAVVVIDRSKRKKSFVLLVFNGPFPSKTVSPAFIRSGLDLKYYGLSYGPPR